MAKCLTCCCRCCLDCVNRFIKFINQNAYVQIALLSENFCTSAVNGLCLVLKNMAAFAFTGSIGGFFMFIGKVTISTGTTCIAYAILVEWPYMERQILSPLTPCIVVFLISYVIASVFMSLFATGTRAIIQSFLVDVELTRKSSGSDCYDGKHRPKVLDDLVKVFQKDN